MDVPLPGSIFVVLSLMFAGELVADWPQWRGPQRDGTSADLVAPQKWPDQLSERWRITVGEGHSSPLVVGDRVYLFTRQQEEEVARCVRAADGKELWRAAYLAPYTMNSAATSHGKGPKSTPVVAAGKLFTLGIGGILSCFATESGRLVWRKNFSKEFTNTSPLYGTATSPIIVDNMCIVHVGGHDKGALRAFDVESGLVRWSFEGDGPAYSSPVLAMLAKSLQVVTYTQDRVVGVSASNGQLLWTVPAKRAFDTNSVSPVIYKDLVILSSDEKGIGAFRIERSGPGFVAREVWRNSSVESYMSTPVVHGARLFGFSYRKRGQFFCLDADNGKLLWEGPGRTGENSAIVYADGLLFCLVDEAKLVLINADASSYEPVKEYQVASSPTWAHPVLMKDRILVKDKTTLACLSFSP